MVIENGNQFIPVSNLGKKAIAVSKGPADPESLVGIMVTHVEVVMGRFDNNFMVAGAGMFLERETRRGLFFLRAESGKFIGYDADGPAGRIRGSIRRTQREGFGWRHFFVARTEGAILIEIRILWIVRFEEVSGPFAAVAGNDDPFVCFR